MKVQQIQQKSTSEPNDCVFVIFGISGHLSRTKLLPALYELFSLDLMPEHIKIVGVTRKNFTIDEINENLIKELKRVGKKVDQNSLDKLARSISIVRMDSSKANDYQKLTSVLKKIDSAAGKQLTRLFYLSVPPKMFETIVHNLGECGLHRCDHDPNAESRLLIEKPFGNDVESARSLITKIEEVFSEDQIYRVDHYLAKETVQNILTFRFKNPIFRSLWDSNDIQSIQITSAENENIEGRAVFYEQTGALRDLIQSHLLQLLALITMEEPESMDSTLIHAQKIKLLKSIEIMPQSKVHQLTVRGQYENYRSDVANPQSLIETFAAIRLNINNKRWSGVPIILRTGKSLPRKITEITLVFGSDKNPSEQKNMLTIRVQPDEGIIISLLAKTPSLKHQVERVGMEFCYNRSFNSKQPDAYEKVLIDAIKGDKTLFATDKEVMRSWEIIQPILNIWHKNDQNLHKYKSGTWGPSQSDELAIKSGTSWLTDDIVK